MKGEFNCTKCGWCCRYVNINVSYQDILRWAKEARYDILAKISYIEHEDKNKRGFYIEDTVTAPKKPCPFLTENNLCSIYATRPRSCADFPVAHSEKELELLECPALPDYEIDHEASMELKKEQGLEFVIAEDRKERLLQILSDARELLAIQARIKEFGDDPQENLFVSAFTNNRTGWTRVGTTPWLSTQNQPTDYVWTATKKAEIGDWDFSNTSRPPTDTLNSVTLYVYAQTVVGSSDNTVYIWDGTSWVNTGITLQTSWGWASIDVSGTIDTWAKVDSAQMYIAHGNTTNRTDVDAAYLLVDYALGSLAVSELDAVTLGESSSVAPLVIPDVIISESTVTVGDTPTVQLTGGAPPDWDINVSDGVTVSESQSVEPLILDINESELVVVEDFLRYFPDQIYVSDNATVQVEAAPPGPASINTSDSVTVGDTLPPWYYDDITVSEWVNVEVVGAVADRSVNVSDSVTTGESQSVEVSDPQLSETDATTIGESVQLEPLAIDIVVSDSATVGETTTVELTIDVFQSDSVSTGEVVDVHRQAAWYHPDAYVINAGSLISGTIEDTWSDNGVKLILQEQNGVPGFNYEFYFYDVKTTGFTITINGYYQGSPGHQKKIQQYNFTTTNWTDLSPDVNDFPSETSDQIYTFPIYNDSDYNDGGDVRIRLIHNSAGSLGQLFFIDLMQLGAHVSVHVNDGATLGDTQNISVSDLQVSETDSATLAEDVTVLIPVAGEYNISVSDNATVGDVAYLDALVIDISESDSSSTTDTATLDALLIDVSETDSITASDTATIDALQLDIAESDSSSTSDVATLDALQIDVVESDSVVTGETSQIYIETSIFETDSAVVTDVAQIDPLVIDVVRQDSVVAGESTTVTIPVAGELYIDVSDNVNVSDTPTLDPLVIDVLASDSVTTGESVDTDAPYVIDEQDNVTVADSLGYYSELVFVDEWASVQVETPVITDRYISVSDGVGVSESSSIEPLVVDVSELESVTVSETTYIELESLITETENIGVGESSSVTVSDPSLSVSDNTSVNEITNVVVPIIGELYISESDGVSTTDTASAISSDPQITESDSFLVSESTSVTVSDPSIFETESVSVAELSSLSFGDFSISVSENTSVSDSSVVYLPVSVYVTDSVLLGDSAVVILPDSLLVFETDATIVGETSNVAIVSAIALIDVLFKGTESGIHTSME